MITAKSSMIALEDIAPGEFVIFPTSGGMCGQCKKSASRVAEKTGKLVEAFGSFSTRFLDAARAASQFNTMMLRTDLLFSKMRGQKKFRGGKRRFRNIMGKGI